MRSISLTLRSAFAEASADTIQVLTRRSFSVDGQAQGEALFLVLILSLSKDEDHAA
jgi:hypothetical protein